MTLKLTPSVRPGTWLRGAIATFLAVGLLAVVASGPAGAATDPQSSLVLDRASAYLFSYVWHDCVVFCRDVEACARVNASRVDCLIPAYTGSEQKACGLMVAVRLSRRGYLYYAPYECGDAPPGPIDAQIQEDPPNATFWPVTPAALYGDWSFEPGQRTRYGRTRWLGKKRFPVRFYAGRTSQHRERSVRRFERIGGATTFFDIWVTPAGAFLPGSYMPGTVFCDRHRHHSADASFDLSGIRVRADGSFAVSYPDSARPAFGVLRGRVHRDYVAGHFRVRDEINGRACTLPRGRVLFKGPRQRAYPRRTPLYER